MGGKLCLDLHPDVSHAAARHVLADNNSYYAAKLLVILCVQDPVEPTNEQHASLHIVLDVLFGCCMPYMCCQARYRFQEPVRVCTLPASTCITCSTKTRSPTYSVRHLGRPSPSQLGVCLSSMLAFALCHAQCLVVVCPTCHTGKTQRPGLKLCLSHYVDRSHTAFRHNTLHTELSNKPRPQVTLFHMYTG